MSSINKSKKFDLERDLLTTDWILKKVEESKHYSQNLYAALCNNDWCKDEIFELIKENSWHCSWRHAGKIIANMRQEGEYVDWYCSGLWNPEMLQAQQFVREGIVTPEISKDLLKLGWVLIANEQF